MPNIGFDDKVARRSLYQKGYEYIDDNFHKLNEKNKLKVALAIIQIFAKNDSVIINNHLTNTNANINAEPVRKLSTDELRAIISAGRAGALSEKTA